LDVTPYPPRRPGRARAALSALVLMLTFAAITVREAGAAVTDPPQFAFTWGTFGTGESQFSNPAGLALDSSGDLYVADSSDHRIQKFDAAGNFLTQWGTFGTGEGQFNNLYGVTVGPSGDVYVADYHNARIERFDADGNFLSEWGTEGQGNGQFLHPEALTTDAAGNVYVCDTGNARIQKFDQDGNFLLTWGSRGTAHGQFRHPEGIAVDASGNVFNVDPGNWRVQVFTSSGTFLRTWGTQGTGAGQFDKPDEGLVIDALGNIYITDTGNDRVQKFDSTGHFLTMFGGLGTGDGQFNHPYGIAINPAGDLYVSDFLNDRIEVFTQAPSQPPRPDALIRRSPSPWVGDGIYNITGVDQTATRNLARGAKGTFLVKAQNDGSDVDRLALRGCSSDAGFTVAYLSGSTTITNAVVNGTYRTGNLGPNASKTIKVVIGARSGTAAGSQKDCLVTVSSAADPAQKDAVGAVAVVT
jgi:sugar lactone lactonase YvrE